jgi:DNA-binding transcriptional MocR family regulator
MTPLERFRYIRSLRLRVEPNSGVSAPICKAILFCLATHADRKGICWPSRRLTAEEAGCSERTVWAAMQWLNSAGLIIVRARPGRSHLIKLTLEEYRDLASTPATIAAPPRQPLPTEVAHVKANMTSHRNPRRSPSQLESQQAADLNSVIPLFPESRRKA